MSLLTQEIIENIEGEVVEKKTLSIINLINEGGLGGQIIIGMLFILLVVALYIYFERLLAIKEGAKVDAK